MLYKSQAPFNKKNDHLLPKAPVVNAKVSFWLKQFRRQNDKEIIADELDNPSLEQLGQDQQAKNQATKEEADKQKTIDLVKRSNRSVVKISSIFPLDLFPNSIIVEESRVTFIFRQFLSSQSHSVEIKDISNVFIETSLFLATLRIVSRTYFQNDIKIGHLSKKKAIRVRMILEGLRTLANNNIDTTDYEISQLIAKTEEFHSDNTE